jgi:DUF4097 and DUF4098 domain-containing protein YvlB
MKGLSLAAAIAILLTASPAQADREYSFDKKESFDGSNIDMIRIDMPSGQIKLSRSQTSEIEVSFKNEIYARDEKEAEKINDKCNYKAEISDGDVLITVDLPRRSGSRKNIFKRIITGDWKEDINFYLRVAIPDGKTIDLISSSADLEVSQLRLNLDVRASSSDIKLQATDGDISCDLSSGDLDAFDHTGSLSVEGRSSDIRIDGLKGDIDLRTSSGDGRLFEITGSATVYSSSGDWRINNVGGDLDIRTSSGDIYVNGVSGSVRAEASSGDIRLNMLTATQGDFDIESGSGDVNVEINPDFEGRLSLRTSSGDINSRISADIETLSDSRLVASVGEGNGRLNVSTSSGDIRITRY